MHTSTLGTARQGSALRSSLLRGLARTFASGLVVILVACGGGGGGGSAGGTVTPPKPAPAPDFPALSTDPYFTLAPITEPDTRAPVAGKQIGRVLGLDGAAAPAGLKVEWIDATDPAAPRVLASSTTDASGAFAIAGSSTLAAADQWLRVTLPGSTQLRAYPTGWTEISVGSEVAVSEITRLRASGGLTARPLSQADLAPGQEGLGLLWMAKYAGQGAAAIPALRSSLVLSAPWNGYLAYLSSATPEGGPGDIASLLPPPASIYAPASTAAATLTDENGIANVTLATRCTDSTGCEYSVQDRADLSDTMHWDAGAIRLSLPAGPDGPQRLIAQAGFLPLIEFPTTYGTKVIYENLKLVDTVNKDIHAAMRITRRVYPVAPVAALGGTVPAIQVVLDYQVALLNKATGATGDLLVREHRWFSPLGGRVRIQTEGLARSGADQQSAAASLVANGGAYEPAQVTLPFATPLDVTAVPLVYRAIAYSAAQDRIYAATDDAGGTLLELDPATLAAVRSVPLAGVTARLAVSADGTRLYAAQAGNTAAELRTSDLALVRRFTITQPPLQTSYDNIISLAVDPSDAERILVVLDDSHVLGDPGVVQMYQGGTLQLRAAPDTGATNYGWGTTYFAGEVAWSGVPNEFLVASSSESQSLYRMRVDSSSYSQLAALELVDSVDTRVVGGEIVMPDGKIHDGSTLAPLRALKLGDNRLQRCLRLDAASDFCSMLDGTNTSSDEEHVRFDNQTGAFLGAYRPGTPSSSVLAQCPRDPGSGVSLADGAPRMIALTGARVLVANGRLALRCGVQVWALHELRH